MKRITLMMMAAATMLCGTKASAQWSTDHENEWYKVTSFPTYAVEKADRTFDVGVSMTKRVSAFANTEDVASGVSINGWNRLKDGGYLHVDIEFGEMLIEGYDVIDRTTTSSGKRCPTFIPVVNFTFPAVVHLKSTQGKRDFDVFQTGFLTKVPTILHYDTGRAFDSPNKAKDFAKANIDVFMADMVNMVTTEALKIANRNCGSLYGYTETTARMEYYHLDSRKCPYIASQNESVEQVLSVVKSSSAEGINAGPILQVIEDYQNIANALDEGVKKQRKAKIKLLYSIAELYLMIDMLDESERMAQTLIDDYKEDDGKDVIKKIKKVRDIFEKFNVNTRHPKI